MIHKIKLQKEFADAVLSGDKCFEIRNNDRGYQKGDKVKFQVMDGSTEMGHALNTWEFIITYVMSGWGIEQGYVVFGIKRIEE